MKNISRETKNMRVHKVTAEGETFLTTVTWESGTAPSGLHYHSGGELLLIESGEMTLFAGDRSWRLQGGDLCLIGENVYHYLTELSSAVRTSVCFTRRGSKNDDKSILPSDGSGAVVFQDARLFSVLSLFMEEEHGGGALADTLLSVLVSRCLQLCGGKSQADSAASGKSLDDVREVLIDDYFSDRYDEALNPAELAGILCVGTRQLGRILQNIYGKSFCEVLTDMRMEAAKNLLKNSEMSQSEIAAAVGIPQQTSFFRTFRKHAGCTPGAYRAKYRKPVSN